MLDNMGLYADEGYSYDLLYTVGPLGHLESCDLQSQGFHSGPVRLHSPFNGRVWPSDDQFDGKKDVQVEDFTNTDVIWCHAYPKQVLHQGAFCLSLVDVWHFEFRSSQVVCSCDCGCDESLRRWPSAYPNIGSHLSLHFLLLFIVEPFLRLPAHGLLWGIGIQRQ